MRLTLSEPQFASRLIEGRVFLVVLVFSAISGFFIALSPSIAPYILGIGYSGFDIGIILLLPSALIYVVNPVLYFVVLYLACGGPLLNRIAGVLTSIILASIVGHILGGFAGSVTAATLHEGTAAYSVFSSFVLGPLFQHVINAVIFAFAVLAFSDISIKWTKTLAAQGLQRTRPAGIVAITVLYILFALLTAFAILLLAGYATSAGYMSLIFISLAALSLLVAAGQVVVAIGLYRGRKWAWVIALIASGCGFAIDAFSLGSVILLGFSGTQYLLFTGQLLGLFLGLLVSIVIFSYLLSIGVRRFFGFVNPMTEAQQTLT